jgi:hypothetical protein
MRSRIVFETKSKEIRLAEAPVWQKERQGGGKLLFIAKALHLDIYVWPMITDYRHGAEKLLVRIPLTEKAHE